MADGKSILEKILRAEQLSDREAMSYAHVGFQVQNQQDMRRNTKRHEAQADAILRAKYEQCGMPEAYQPPDEEDDEMSPTLINCHFNGDESVQSITQALASIGSDGKGQPQQPGPSPQKPKSKLSSLWPLAAGLGIGIGGMALYQMTRPTDPAKIYDIETQPFIPYEPKGT